MKGEPKIVRVEWDDARSVYEQMELSAATERVTLARRITVGYLVKRTKEIVLVCGTYDEAEKKIDREHTPDEDGGADFTVIPRGWVKSIVFLNAASEQEREEA